MADKDANVADDCLDIHGAEFLADTAGEYRRLRERCPVAHSGLYGGFSLLSRYDDVYRAALDWRSYTSAVVGVTAIPVITPRKDPQLPIELDPPLHTRYRALVNPVFSKKRLEEMRSTIQTIVRELVDGIAQQGEMEIISDFAIPMSVRTLAAFTSLPLSDSEMWISWIRRMFDVTNREDGAVASAEFGEYIDNLIAVRRASPTDDFIGLLMKSEVEGHNLSDKEIHSFCRTIFGAGFETTADAIGVMLYLLAKSPEDRKRLIEKPELADGAVDEFLRLISPIQIFGRNATQDLQLHGETINEGDVVALAFASANRDPDAFPEADQCILDRSPNRHLAFGAGPHHCLGAPVARLEMIVTLNEFLPRIPMFSLRSEDEVVWKTRGDRCGISYLPMKLGR